jgi:derlin-1
MDPQEWYSSMPKVTKFLFTGALVTTLAGNFGLVSPYTLLLNFSAIYNKFEVRKNLASTLAAAPTAIVASRYGGW